MCTIEIASGAEQKLVYPDAWVGKSFLLNFNLKQVQMLEGNACPKLVQLSWFTMNMKHKASFRYEHDLADYQGLQC